MPELPEVETIARGLRQGLRGRRIVDLFILTPEIISGDPVRYQAGILGKTVTNIWRRGKLLIFDLDEQLHLVFHLKMTGRVWIATAETEPDAHTHISFFLDDGNQLFFQDQRRFGYSIIFSPEGLRQWDFFAMLGPEPLEIGNRDFTKIFSRRRAAIKSLLLDQHCLAGIGNIYADESLFMAGIHPACLACDVSEARYQHLYAALRAVLQKAILLGGSSVRDYRNAAGEPGAFQNEFQVYGKKGQPCPCCSRALETMKIAGRTSTFCANCQVKKFSRS